MKNSILVILVMLSFQAFSQQSFVEKSHLLKIEREEFAKINSEARKKILQSERFRNNTLRDIAIPVTSIASEKIARMGNRNLTIGPGVVMGNTSETHGASVQVRVVNRFQPRHDLKKLLDMDVDEYNEDNPDFKGIDPEAFRDILDQIRNDAILDNGLNIFPEDIAVALDELPEDDSDIIPNFDASSGLEDFDYASDVGYADTEITRFVLLNDYDVDDYDLEEDLSASTDFYWGDLGVSYETQKFNYHASFQYNFFFGKSANFDGSNFTYDNFSILALNGGIDYNPCTRGGLDLEVGPAIELGGGGSSFGFNARIGGYYDLTTPEKRIARNIYTGEPKLNYSLNAGLNYYNFGNGFDTLVLGVGLQLNFDKF